MHINTSTERVQTKDLGNNLLLAKLRFRQARCSVEFVGLFVNLFEIISVANDYSKST